MACGTHIDGSRETASVCGRRVTCQRVQAAAPPASRAQGRKDLGFEPLDPGITTEIFSIALLG
jgi:hypothetical protein